MTTPPTRLYAIATYVWIGESCHVHFLNAHGVWVPTWDRAAHWKSRQGAHQHLAANRPLFKSDALHVVNNVHLNRVLKTELSRPPLPRPQPRKFPGR